MRVIFKKLIVKDFKSFYGEHTLDLEDLGVGLHFVAGSNEAEPELGSNGAGKSSLWDAMFWCFYGKTLRDLKNPAVIPWQESDQTSVEVILEVDDVLYKVYRQVSPSRFIVSKDGGSYRDLSPAEITTNILGLSQDGFLNTIIKGQFNPLFLDLKPRDQISLFSDILDLEYWVNVSDFAKRRAVILQETIVKLEAECKSLEGAAKVLKDNLKSVEAQSREWSANRQARVRGLRSQQKELIEELTEKEDEKASLLEQINDLEQKYNKKKQQLDSMNEEIVACRKDITLLEIEQRTYDSKLDELTNELSLIDGSSNRCYVCGQVLKSKTQIRKHRESVQKKIDELKSTAPTKARYKKAELEKLLKKQEALSEMADSFWRRISSIRSKSDTVVSEYANLEAHRVQLDRSIEELSETSNVFEDQITKYKSERKKIMSQIREFRKKIKLKRELEYRTRYWVRGFKEVRLTILEEVLEHLQVVANSNLITLGLVEDWSISFNLEKETKSGNISQGFNTTIESPYNDDPVPWASWSGGESQRLRLAVSFALAEVLLDRAGVDPDLEIWDEPTTHTSPEGIEDLCELLSERASRLNKKIFYSDHQTVESVLFSTVLTVKKDDKGSHIY